MSSDSKYLSIMTHKLSLVEVIWIGGKPDENKSILVISAGFSDAAYNHCIDKFGGFADIGICKYSDTCREEQRKACDSKNPELENAIYRNCANQLKEQLSQFSKVSIAAKSAGGGMVHLATMRNVGFLALQAPHIVSIDCSLDANGIYLSWCEDDDKIPIKNMQTSENFLKIACKNGNFYSETYTSGGHNFADEFVTRVRSFHEYTPTIMPNTIILEFE